MTGPAIGIVGLGTVGSALAQRLSPRYILLRCDPALPDGLAAERLAAECAIVFVCVPTPAGPGGAADISILASVVARLSQQGGVPPLVVIKSTVPPGTTQALAMRHPRLPVVASPEFLRHGSALADLQGATRVLLGLPVPAPDETLLTQLGEVLRHACPQAEIVRADAAAVELAKYATNAFLALKVTFANQVEAASTALDIDYAAVAALLALDPRVGDSHLAVPGPDGLRGFGGACLPKDVAALLALAGQQLPLLRAAVEWNDEQGRNKP
ncbi:MAG: UDP-glucose/GDP-mannose dehydrogenase family protein [Burkholderiales bacterium]|nr:UDP-glucose/GDP-mannose dehydrogenase family protein [Burkholderiales bacterium]